MAKEAAGPDVLATTVESMVKAGRRVEVVGKVVDGKLSLDPAALHGLTAKGGRFAFVAVNAPFAG